MNTSQTSSMRPVIIKLLLGAAATVGALLMLMAVVSQTSADDDQNVVVVNSTANTTNDGCMPNKENPNVGPTCTLRDAINLVNDGLANEIRFHKPLFSKASPGVIHLDIGDEAKDGIGSTDNCLPSIQQEVVIDSTNTGVILDGDSQNDQDNIQSCGAVIKVNAGHNGFDFTLLGGKNFIIREFDGGTHGIFLDGFAKGEFSFGNVVIDGVVIQDGDDIGDDDYNIHDGIKVDATNLFKGVFNNNVITADDDGIDIDIRGVCDNGTPNSFISNDGIAGVPIGGCKMSSSQIEITNNNIVGDFDESGSGKAVHVDYSADLNGKITLLINDNPNLTSLGDEGVQIDFCCDASNSAINIQVNNNSKVHGGPSDDAVQIDIHADESDDGPVDVDIEVNDNGLIDAGDDGVDIDVLVCCHTSFSTSSITVNGNDDIVGVDDGVVIDADIGCGDGNQSHIEVNDNNRIEGQTDDGVDIEVYVGNVARAPCPVSESDENHSVVEVNRNGRINGGGDEGVDIENYTGNADGSGDDNVSETHIVGNERIDGSTQGVEVETHSGSTDGPDADDNVTTVVIEDNEDIRGRNSDGVQIDASSGTGDVGSGVGPESIYDGSGGDGHDGDDNTVQVFIRNNGNLEGGDGSGVDIEAIAGGGHQSAVRNLIQVDVTDNGSLEGSSDSDGRGLSLQLTNCCQVDVSGNANRNEVLVSGNDDIRGFNSDGIYTILCCNLNIVEISKNGEIRGNGGSGILYRVPIVSDGSFADSPRPPCPRNCGLFSNANFLTIVENEIFNSQNNGIDIFGGAFQVPTDAGLHEALPCGQGDEPTTCNKSLIANNSIHHNRDHGIWIHSSFGLNIIGNEIWENGDDPQRDAGIEIVSDMNNVHTPQFFGTLDKISIAFAVAGNNQAFDAIGFIIASTRANQNLISQNSIYANVGQGIQLLGDRDKEGRGVHSIGCNNFAAKDFGVANVIAPSPNDCIPFPVVQTLSDDKLVGTACSLCVVEIFIADAEPPDQPPLGDQHGEGRTFITSGTADDLGNWSIDLPCDMGNMAVTATATSKDKNTSEFARNFQVLDIPCTPTPTPTFTPTDTATPVPPTNTPTNTPVAPPTATPVVEKVCGDVNMDGAVNSVDAQLILQLKAALITSLLNERNADVNNDGEITSVDAALILQFTAGLISADVLTCP